MKTFTYTRQVGPAIYSEQTDETFYDEEEFDYEVDYRNVRSAISEIVCKEYFPRINLNREQKIKLEEAIESLIVDCDLYDIFEEYLKDYFEDEAMSFMIRSELCN